MRSWMLAPLALPLLSQPSQEWVTGFKDQQALSVTIYNDNLALIKDLREIKLPMGPISLAWREVSAQMRPETALLRNLTHPKDFTVYEQNFDFDLLTPQKLLDKHVGKKVVVARTLPNAEGAGAKEIREEAQILSTQQGIVLKYADRVETGISGRVIFENVPDNLRERPTLVIDLQSPVEKAQKLELSYLSSGLRWKADYVANLSEDEKNVDLSGWVTLTNESGTAYPNARLQLVAGDVNRVQESYGGSPMMQDEMRMAKMSAVAVKEENLFEYHLYTLPRPTTLKENQTKQVALLTASNVPIRKEYVLKGQRYYYQGQYGEIADKLKVGVFVEFDNRKESNMGMPMPKGVVRVYKRDTSGQSQFVGEDSIDHTPDLEKVRLKLGDAFDITARRRQTEYKSLGSVGKTKDVHEAAFEIEIKNAKKEKVTVQVIEPLWGDWEMVEKSHPFSKESSGTAVFKVDINPSSSAKLTYRVRMH